MSIEPDFDVRKSRDAIKAWVDRLASGPDNREDPETEAACWYRGLPEGTRMQLESELDRLWSDPDDLRIPSSGPLGELIGRFSRPIGVEDSSKTSADEVPDLAEELRKLEQSDPSWYADWRAFEDSLEDGDRPGDGIIEISS